jgi:hypothetical protein
MRNVFYRSLVRWNRVEEIIFLIDDEKHHDQVRELLIDALDHVVLETALNFLKEELHHEFMDKLHQGYDDEGTLVWLKENAHDGVTEALVMIISETKEHFRGILVAEEDQ